MLVGRGGVEQGRQVRQEADRGDGDAAVVGGGEELAVQLDGVQGVFGAAPGEGAARVVVGDLAGELAERVEEGVEEGFVGQGPAGADGDRRVAVVGEDCRGCERGVGRAGVDVDAEDVDIWRGCR